MSTKPKISWERISPFRPENVQQETWILRNGEETGRFSVEVTLGKPIDILSLKIQKASDLKTKIEAVRDSRGKIYSDKANLEGVKVCPICGNPSNTSKQVLNIHGAIYVCCQKCFHYYILFKPTDKFLDNFYRTSKEYQSTYADKKTQASRLEWISIPKAKYVLAQYQKRYGRMPKKILDIGAGSGHFVYALRQMGVDCDGIEISSSGRKFAKEVFDVVLFDADYLKDAAKYPCDIVTFWGLIEHVSQPVAMLAAAKKSGAGMVVAEVPRWECFSTGVHKTQPDSVIRHLDPMDHMQCFSDSSLATAFVFASFDITAAWYFGMDAYELFSQLTASLEDDRVMDLWGKHIPVLQESLDAGRLSDFGLFVGTPHKA